MKDKASSLSTYQLRNRVEVLEEITEAFPAQHDAAKGAREYLHVYYLELAKRANPHMVSIDLETRWAGAQTGRWASSDPIVRVGPNAFPDWPDLPRNHGNPWTPVMDRRLAQHWCQDKWSMTKIAEVMGRSQHAIQCRLVHLGIIPELT